jgi:DNA sulfur modification protein DndD
MFIKEISLYNFRIYKNSHKLFLEPDPVKNVFVISGNNGYGKTTFLTSLVWCLYGKQIRDVDDSYRDQINEVGGYSKFIQSCLNRLAYREGDRFFEVSITFGDVNIPSVPCHDLKISRRGHYNSGSDEFFIMIDGQENELTKEVGNEIFVHDYILPKEIAKFFFFDSEKIVSLAEMKSISGKRQLSKAYSEVLGIKKYEDLRRNLTDLLIRFKKGSAKLKDKERFEKLVKEKENLENAKLDFKIQLETLDDDKLLMKDVSNTLQEKLIRKGSSLSIDELNNLRIKKYSQEKEIEDLKDKFREMLDLAPFAISGNLFSEMKEQCEKEKLQRDQVRNQELLNRKGREILKAFARIDPEKSKVKVSQKADKFYKEQLHQLIEKLLHSKDSKEIDEVKVLHGFTDDEYHAMHSIYLQLQTTYAIRLREISKAIQEKRLQHSRVSRKLSDAESKESDGIIAKYRKEKQKADEKIVNLQDQMDELNQRIGSVEQEIATKNRIIEELAKKIKIHERYKEKDKLARRLIQELDEFLVKIKKEKKASLEKKILASLKELMHKKAFIDKIEVRVEEEIIDIFLYNPLGEEIGKDTLFYSYFYLIYKGFLVH